MFPSNAGGIVCPGCQPNDFPVPHICKPVDQVPPWYQPAPMSLLPAPSCEHCWCREYPDPFKPHEQCCMCLTRRVRA